MIFGLNVSVPQFHIRKINPHRQRNCTRVSLSYGHPWHVLSRSHSGTPLSFPSKWIMVSIVARGKIESARKTQIRRRQRRRKSPRSVATCWWRVRVCSCDEPGAAVYAQPAERVSKSAGRVWRRVFLDRQNKIQLHRKSEHFLSLINL